MTAVSEWRREVKRLGDMQDDFGGKILYVGHDCCSYHNRSNVQTNLPSHGNAKARGTREFSGSRRNA